MVQHHEFSAPGALDAQKAQTATTIKQRFRIFAPETRDHLYIVLRITKVIKLLAKRSRSRS
jgi:hypothetical protein